MRITAVQLAFKQMLDYLSNQNFHMYSGLSSSVSTTHPSLFVELATHILKLKKFRSY